MTRPAAYLRKSKDAATVDHGVPVVAVPLDGGHE